MMCQNKRRRIDVIRSRTPKRAAQERLYLKRRKEWIIGKPCAAMPCNEMAEEVHHARGRIGSLLLDERFWIPLCQKHHEQVHRQPEWARTQGLLCEKGKWGSNKL